MAFDAALTEWLGTEFPGAELVDFGFDPGGRVAGVVAWTGFDGLAQIDRQQRLWAALRARFDRDDLRLVGMILTFTPRELQSIDADR